MPQGRNGDIPYAKESNYHDGSFKMKGAHNIPVVPVVVVAAETGAAPMPLEHHKLLFGESYHNCIWQLIQFF